MSQKTKSFIARFLKGFIAGGVSSVLLQLGTASTSGTWQDFNKLAISLVIGFLTGGLLAIEKMLSWTDSGEITAL